MRITGILIFFFNCAISTYAQTSPWFRDDFDSTTTKWIAGNSDSVNYTVNNGQYIITNKKKSETIGWINQNIYIDRVKDFTLEVKLKIPVNANHNPAGFFIGNSYSDMYFFSVNPYEKTFLIGVMRKYDTYRSSNIIYTYKEENVYGWQSTDAYTTETDYQVLTFQKKSEEFFFYINGQEVFSINNPNFCRVVEQYVGFMTSADMEVHIDYILFDQDNWQNALSPNTAPIKETRLPTTINTYASEIDPVLSPDKKTLYFTRIGHKDNYPLDKSERGKQDGDVYYSEYKDSVWTEAKRMEYGISNGGNNGIVSMSPDGNSILLYGSYYRTRSFSELGDGLAISRRISIGWSYPENLMIRNFYTYPEMISYFLADNGYVLLLSIKRADSKGGADLYVSFKLKDNTWSEPKSLGDQINTAGEESTPFLSADMKTLYFSSSNLPGYGNVDTYMSKRLDDTWRHWSTPVNLGPSVNNTGYNAYYRISTDATTIYYSSSHNSIGKEDIFMAELPKELAPEPVTMITGRVLDAKTKLPLSAMIFYEKLGDSTTIGYCRSSPLNGSYTILLPYENTYGYYAQAEGYIAINEHVDLQEMGTYKEVTQDIYMIPIQIGETIGLNNVFFVRSKAELLPASYSELDRLVKILQEHPKIEIEIRGYTDGYGDTELNIKLSEERAKTVAAYLIQNGIYKSRIKTEGYGQANAASPNNTEANREKNRRVEFVIIKK